MKIYSLTLDIKNPDVPFKIERSISSQSEDLIKTFFGFQIELIKLLNEIHKEELKKLEPIINDDDIPF